MGNNQCGCGSKHVDNMDTRKNGKYSSGKKPKKKPKFNSSVTTDQIDQEDQFFETDQDPREESGTRYQTNDTMNISTDD